MSDSDVLFSAETIAAHMRWVRNEAGGVRLTLEGADLSGTRPHGLILTAARFVRCRFAGTIWSGAFLNQIELLECDFDGAQLVGVEMAEATIEDCVFTDADLSRCQLMGARIAGGTWRGATVTDANLAGLEADHVDFVQTGLDRSSLVRSTWESSRLASACLSRTDFRGANLQGVDLRACDLDHTNFDGTILTACGVWGTVGTPVVGAGGLTAIDPDFSRAFDGSDIGDRERLLAAWT